MTPWLLELEEVLDELVVVVAGVVVVGGVGVGVARLDRFASCEL